MATEAPQWTNAALFVAFSGTGARMDLNPLRPCGLTVPVSAVPHPQAGSCERCVILMPPNKPRDSTVCATSAITYLPKTGALRAGRHGLSLGCRGHCLGLGRLGLGRRLSVGLDAEGLEANGGLSRLLHLGDDILHRRRVPGAARTELPVVLEAALANDLGAVGELQKHISVHIRVVP